jgi:gamma-glutamylputrescine oxidase
VLLRKELGVVENSYYEATVARPAPSPPLAGDVTADVCIVGAGYAGLSAALELAKRGYRTIVLEAQRVGWGASGRNGGQVLVGMGAEGECAIEEQLPPDQAKVAWDVSVEGLDLVQERIRDYGIDCDYRPGYLSLVVKRRQRAPLERWARHIVEQYGYDLRFVEPGDMRDWVASDRYHSAVFDPRSGHMHPLKFCLGVARAAREAGAVIHENSPALHLERGPRPVLKTGQGSVTCEWVLLAGNVYLDEYGDEIAPELGGRIIPVGTYIIATEPMDPARADGLMRGRPAASDENHILDYFRASADHRLLFGAGESYTARTPRNLVPRMRAKMLGVFPQLADLAITHSWGGFVDVSMNMAPDFGRLGTNVFYLQGFSGHGLSLSGMAGKLVAEAIDGQARRFDVFAKVKHRRFPGGPLMRAPALALGMLYYRLLDLL